MWKWGFLWHPSGHDFSVYRAFKSKIDYLKKVHILPESCYILLDKARERRNLIHEHPLVYKFTDEDLELFSQAHNVSANLLRVMIGKFPEDVKQGIVSRCETLSQRYLARAIEVAEVDDSGDPGVHPPEDTLTD